MIFVLQSSLCVGDILKLPRGGGVNRQAKTFSTKTRNKLGKTGSASVKTGSTGLHELN
jgi:hypothetical protein